MTTGPNEPNDQSPPAPDAVPVSMPAVLLPILAAAFNQASQNESDVTFIQTDIRRRCLASGLKRHRELNGESATADEVLAIRTGVNDIMVRLQALAQEIATSTALPIAPGVQLSSALASVEGCNVASWQYISNKLRDVAP